MFQGPAWRPCRKLTGWPTRRACTSIASGWQFPPKAEWLCLIRQGLIGPIKCPWCHSHKLCTDSFSYSLTHDGLNYGKLTVRLINLLVPVVAGSYIQLQPNAVVSTWLIVMQTSRLTTKSEDTTRCGRDKRPNSFSLKILQDYISCRAKLPRLAYLRFSSWTMKNQMSHSTKKTYFVLDQY